MPSGVHVGREFALEYFRSLTNVCAEGLEVGPGADVRRDGLCSIPEEGRYQRDEVGGRIPWWPQPEADVSGEDTKPFGDRTILPTW